MLMQKMSKSGKIDFMKIDIEGYEKEIFPDVASWPVMCEMRCIAAEIHDWFEPGCSDALNKFLQVLISSFVVLLFLLTGVAFSDPCIRSASVVLADHCALDVPQRG